MFHVKHLLLKTVQIFLYESFRTFSDLFYPHILHATKTLFIFSVLYVVINVRFY